MAKRISPNAQRLKNTKSRVDTASNFGGMQKNAELCTSYCPGLSMREGARQHFCAQNKMI